MKKRIFSLLTILAVLMGMALTQTAGAAAPRNFRIRGIISGYRNHVIPLEMTTQLKADMINDTSEIRLRWKVSSEKEKDLTDVPLGKAEIDQETGLLTPLQEGMVKVTVTEVNYGGQSATIYLTIARAEMKVSTDDWRILKGSDTYAHAYVVFLDQGRYPQYDPKSTGDNRTEWYVKHLTGDDVAWTTSSSALIADRNGKLTAEGIAEVTVTASSLLSPEFKASTTVSVLDGYIDLEIPEVGILTDVSINFSPTLLAVAHHLREEREDAVGWELVEGHANLINRTTENTPEDNFLVQLEFLDSGRTVVRAYLKADPTVRSDYVFNVLPSFTELSDLVYTAIDSFRMEQYTAQRWNNLQLAIQEARKMIEERTATQSEINAMIERLQKVMLEMEEPDFELPESKPGGTLNGNQGTSDQIISGTPGTEGTYIDGTSDQTVTWQEEIVVYDFFWLYVGIAAGVVIIAGVVVVLIVMKKKKQAAAAGSGDAPTNDSAKEE